MRLVVGLGGNALLRPGEAPDAEVQRRNLRVAAGVLAALAEDNELVVTHGNGPQVGLLALQAQSYAGVPPYPLDVLGAETEGMLGYLIERELRNRLPDRAIAGLLTQVAVDPRDPAFGHPVKPIGAVYERAEAERLTAERGWTFVPRAGGHQRVVASPEPRAILELDTVRLLVEAGAVVICAGGGGVPVVITEAEGWIGVEAVVDKDLSTALLARGLEADMLLLLTDVDAVYEGWGSPGARALDTLAPADVDALVLEAGTMGPKVEAACRFAAAAGRPAAIGSLEEAPQVLAGSRGTRVIAAVSR
ncbi:MAG: carbamate kinase [Chromatiales bacterium]